MIGIPDEVLGQTIKAFVVARDGEPRTPTRYSAFAARSFLATWCRRLSSFWTRCRRPPAAKWTIPRCDAGKVCEG